MTVDQMVFRRPLTMLVPMAAVLAGVALISPSPVSWVFVSVFLVSYGLLTQRQRLVCAPQGVEVTVFATRRIPWAEIRGFQAGSWLRGGTNVITMAGIAWSPAPASWWGGPASAADLAALEQARPTG